MVYIIRDCHLQCRQCQAEGWGRLDPQMLIDGLTAPWVEMLRCPRCEGRDFNFMGEVKPHD